VGRTPTTNIYRLSGAKPYFAAAGCTVRSDDRQSATVSCAGRSNLVRLETDLPGWRADVDGHPLPIRRASDLFQAVPVPAGNHTIRFSYRPPNILFGELAFVAGVVLLAASGRRRRRPQIVSGGRAAR
jgi:hypothetical protein